MNASPASAVRPAHCPHCGTAVEGTEDRYCCHGCEMAAAIISGAGLERYYDEREQVAPRPEALPALGWEQVPAIQLDDGTCEVRIQVDGLRCASCVWVTEEVLSRTDGVAEATVSYATGRATLRFDPAAVKLEDLAGRVAALGYSPRPVDREGGEDRELLVRLGVAAFVAANVMMASFTLYGAWGTDIAPRYVGLFQYLSLVLATPAVFFSAAPFFEGAWGSLKHGVLSMDLPISIAVAVLYVHGIVATFSGVDTYLDSLTMLVMLLLAGRVLESRGRKRAAEAAQSLAGALPATARKVVDDAVQTVPVDQLTVGDLIDIGAGEDVPADGTVVHGEAEAQMALLTGESTPRRVIAGDRVVAGTVVQDGSVRVRVEGVGETTLLSRMAEELANAADRGMSPTAADRIAPWFTALTLGVAVLTFLGWGFFASWGLALEHTVAVLVVACPCALALSQPLAAAAGLGAAARRGLLLRSGDALMRLADVDTVALDKTGTVTGGEPVVVHADDAVLRIASGLERHSGHPIARAILREAVARGIPLPMGLEVHETAGEGIRGLVDGTAYALGRGGPGEVVLRSGGEVVGIIELADVLRPDASQALGTLSAQGLRLALLTGDHAEVARRIGGEAGLHDIVAELSPQDKVAWIRAQQAQGHKVLFAGDGLNDGPALAAADAAVAMGTGAASSVLVADGVVTEAALGPLVAGLHAAREARIAVRHNLMRSALYNILAVGAAVAGLVNPLVAAVAMPLSSALVLWGASRVEVRVARALGD